MQKKLLMLLLATWIFTSSFGQVKYGFKVGATQSFIKEKGTGTNQDVNLKGGVQIGGFVDIALSNNLSIRSSLQFTQKGFKLEEGNFDGPYFWNRNISTSYLELPVDVVYNIHIANTTKLFIGAGTALSVGLSGKVNAIVKATDGAGQLGTLQTSNGEPFKKPGYKRIDLGADFLTGMQFKRFIIAVNYIDGLMNILNYDPGIQTTKNRSFAFTIGYFISKSK